MKIFFDDGSRIYQNSGYGNLARSLAQSLVNISGVTLYINRIIPTDPGIDISLLLDNPNVQVFKDQPIDFIFRVYPPSVSKIKNKKVILYTQNALGGLREDWKKAISQVDGVIVPGKFDQTVFSAFNPHVYTCPQTIDNTAYSFQKKYRPEGVKAFTFLYVGSFSYRKGVDLLLDGFAQTFSSIKDKAHLHMVCPSGLGESENNVTRFIELIRNVPDNLQITCNTNLLTPAWMRRIYNRSDAVVTLSRGEGWCMPLHEALLCEKPVIAPNSTAMKEFLPTTGTIKLPVTEKPVATIDDLFGVGFKQTYGGDGITYYEPNITALTPAVLDVMKAHRSYQAGAKLARKKILQEYTIDKNTQRLEVILNTWLQTF